MGAFLRPCTGLDRPEEHEHDDDEGDSEDDDDSRTDGRPWNVGLADEDDDRRPTTHGGSTAPTRTKTFTPASHLLETNFNF